MAFGNYVVRVAPSADKSKWKMEIHKSARAALKAARKYAVLGGPRGNQTTPQVCVFNMNKWGAKPVCIKPATLYTYRDQRRGRQEFSKRKFTRDDYYYAPARIPEDRPGGKMKRLARDSWGLPIVKLDGYRRRKSRR
jgi:hypothetical protein